MTSTDIAMLCLHNNVVVFFTEENAAPEPEPVPVVEKPVRSRGKTPVTTRTSSRRQTKVRHMPSPTLKKEKSIFFELVPTCFYIILTGGGGNCY